MSMSWPPRPTSRRWGIRRHSCGRCGLRERILADGSPGWSVDGSPTDAVSLAFLGYFDVGFDLVASGINYGANLGDDVTYSGTVERRHGGGHQRVPRVRHVAGVLPASRLFALAARMAQLVAVNILEHGLAPGELLNINVPAISATSSRGSSDPDGQAPLSGQLIERLDPRGIPTTGSAARRRPVTPSGYRPSTPSWNRRFAVTAHPARPARTACCDASTAGPGNYPLRAWRNRSYRRPLDRP